MIPIYYPGSVQLIKLLHKTLNIEPDSLLLDNGCGDLFISNVIAEVSGAIVVGVDIKSEKMKRFRFINIMKCAADSRFLPFREECFDYVVCINVLEHIKEDDRVIQEIARVTRDNSKVFISVPNSYSDIAFFLKEIMHRLDTLVGHVKRYSLTELVDLLGQSNFYCYYFHYSALFLGWLTSLSIINRNSNQHHSIGRKVIFFKLLLNGFIEALAMIEQRFFLKFRCCAQVAIYALKGTRKEMCEESRQTSEETCR
jgi:SAM-dependent methyltransferase